MRVCVCIHRRIERTNKCLVSLSLWTITFRRERERGEGDDERQFVHFFFAFVFWFTSREKQKKNDDDVVVGHFQSSRLPNSQRVEFEVCVRTTISLRDRTQPLFNYLLSSDGLSELTKMMMMSVIDIRAWIILLQALPRCYRRKGKEAWPRNHDRSSLSLSLMYMLGNTRSQ